MTPDEGRAEAGRAAARERGERLRRFAEGFAGKPVVWGEDDCSTFPAQWVATERGVELDWPAYSSRDEADAIIAGHGGLANVWDMVARQAGLSQCYDEFPPLGSVCITETRRFGQVGGILLHARVLLWRNERDLTMLWARQHTIVKVWTV